MRNRSGKKHFLVVLEEDTTVSIKVLASQIGEKNLSFASEKRLFDYLALTPGSVSPFGLINDSEGQVAIYVEDKVLKSELLVFHPNDNRASIQLTNDSLELVMKHLGYTMKRLEIL
jgi:Ala-tRNA(Pro) deacylase